MSRFALVYAVCPGWLATDPNNPGGLPIPQPLAPK